MGRERWGRWSGEGGGGGGVGRERWGRWSGEREVGEVEWGERGGGGGVGRERWICGGEGVEGGVDVWMRVVGWRGRVDCLCSWV